MLGASCPVEDCYTPLMRNKQGKVRSMLAVLIRSSTNLYFLRWCCRCFV
jgi:hypothetical protein